MSSEAHSPTKHVGFNVMAIKSEHLQICVCTQPLRLMESQKSWADSMNKEGKEISRSEYDVSKEISRSGDDVSKEISRSEDDVSNKYSKKRKIGKTNTKSNQITDCPIMDEMVQVKELKRELARSPSPTPGHTPKKAKKLQSVGDHGPSIAQSNFTRLSRSPYSHCQGAVVEDTDKGDCSLGPTKTP